MIKDNSENVKKLVKILEENIEAMNRTENNVDLEVYYNLCKYTYFQIYEVTKENLHEIYKINKERIGEVF